MDLHGRGRRFVDQIDARTVIARRQDSASRARLVFSVLPRRHHSSSRTRVGDGE
jgi:hypothetical protein